jgi:hypothetical protein
MAHRKEQIINVKKGISSVEETIEVNDMLIDSIKAKLAILDNV